MLIFFLVVLLAHSSDGLIIYFAQANYSTSVPRAEQAFRNITTINLKSVYTTLGTHPTSPLSSPLLLLSESDLDNKACTCETNVSGKIAILNGNLPPLFGCNRDKVGKIVALVKILQQQGAIAVVLPAQEEYMNGRMTGFSSYLTIPVLVSPNSVLSFIAENADLIENIELPPISGDEIRAINLLGNLYISWLIISMALYCALIVLLTTILIMEAERLYTKKKYFSHGAVLRLASFASVLGCFLWLILDPFGSNGYGWWYPSLAYSFHQAFYVVSLLCVLRMWTMASTSSIAFLKKPSLISYITYTLALCVVVSGTLNGALWYNSDALLSFLTVFMFVLLAAGIAFVIFGKTFLLTFIVSNNHGPNSHVLPRKISIFILIYICWTIVNVCVYFTKPMGSIFGTFFSSLYIALAYFSLFLLLFFPKMANRQRKKTRKPFVEMTDRKTSDPNPTQSEPTTSSTDPNSNSTSSEIV